MTILSYFSRISFQHIDDEWPLRPRCCSKLRAKESTYLNSLVHQSCALGYACCVSDGIYFRRTYLVYSVISVKKSNIKQLHFDRFPHRHGLKRELHLRLNRIRFGYSLRLTRKCNSRLSIIQYSLAGYVFIAQELMGDFVDFEKVRLLFISSKRASK